MVTQVATGSIGDEGRNVSECLGRWCCPAKGCCCVLEQLRQRGGHTGFHQNAHHAKGCPPKGKGVFLSGGQQANAPDAHDGFELVGQRHGQALGVAGQAVACEARVIVPLDGIGDGIGLSVVLRVVAANHTLQLWKLADHVGEQVGLGELRSPLGGLWRRPQCFGPLACEGAESGNPLGLAANLVVIDHLREASEPRFKRTLAVLIEEELRIGEPRTQHPLVALPDHGGVFGGEV